MKWYLRAYSGTENLGDAVQTLALARLLPGVTKSVVFYRPVPPDTLLLVNGWLGHAHVPANRAIFAGIYLKSTAPSKERFLEWIRQSTALVGARDAATLAILQAHHIRTAFCGCAAMTFPRYDGPRWGIEHIDDETSLASSNRIAKGMRWKEQWDKAVILLNRIQKAERVYTCRLHVVLPCLGFGTPVYYHDPRTNYGGDIEQRFSILTAMGIDRHQLQGSPVDITPWSDQYKNTLRTLIGDDLEEKDVNEVPFPEVVN